VLEAKLDRGRGPVATCSCRTARCNVGDTFIAGPIVGASARSSTTAAAREVGRAVDAGRGARPRVPALARRLVPGRSTIRPRRARSRCSGRRRPRSALRRRQGRRGSRSSRCRQQLAEGGIKELPIIIKADVQGSAEVLADTLAKLSDDA
jgi:translation initiation factor IF-2